MKSETVGKILIGEDDSGVRNYIASVLHGEGYQVEAVASSREVLDSVKRSEPVSAIFLDPMLSTNSGFGTLRSIRQLNNAVPVVVLSQQLDDDHLVHALKSGATVFLAKPIDPASLHEVIRKILKPASAAQAELSRRPNLMFMGSNPVMAEISRLLPRIAPSDVAVLIQGETGTGKEVLARQVHALSARAGGPFIKLNCAAVPAELAESELFGYERGAFTGAFQRKQGIFELAEGGTIFLDEIGDTDIRLQSKLLQVLQDREYRRLGGKETVQVNVRIIAATHWDLPRQVAQNLFREDLYYRLDGFSLCLPPLRERREDIVPLAEFLLSKNSVDGDSPVITPALREDFENYDWPGNVRQLENIVKKYLVLRDPQFIRQELHRNRRLPRQFAPPTVTPARLEARPASIDNAGTLLRHASKAKDSAEAQAILTVLTSTKWNRKQAAELLRIDYKALLYKIKKLELDVHAAL